MSALKEYKPSFPRSVSGRRWRTPFDVPAVERVSVFMQTLYESAPLSDRDREALLKLHSRLQQSEVGLRLDRSNERLGLRTERTLRMEDDLPRVRADLISFIRRLGLRASDFAEAENVEGPADDI